MKSIKLFISAIALSVILLVGCTEDFVLCEDNCIKFEESTISENPVDEVVEDVEKVDSEVTISELESKMLDIYNESLGESTKVSFMPEGKIYEFIPIGDDFSKDLLVVMDKKDLDSWNQLVSSYKQLSKGAKEQLGSGYSFVLANPISHDKYILHIMDGVVVYDLLNN